MNPEVASSTTTNDQVEVCALKVFGLGDRLVESGEWLLVSQSRASYLRFLGLVEVRTP